MDEKFAWFTIEMENGEACLYFNNKKGVRRREARSTDYGYIQSLLAKRLERKASMDKTITEAIRKVMTDPEALKRLQESRK